jgi:hypothetical protein
MSSAKQVATNGDARTLAKEAFIFAYPVLEGLQNHVLSVD